jgi:hypothetical protein
MAYYPCLCGSRIDLKGIPNRAGYFVLPEERLETLAGRLVELCVTSGSHEECEQKVYNMLLLSGLLRPHIYECSQCGRLAVVVKQSDEMVARWYEPSASSKYDSLASVVRMTSVKEPLEGE